MGNESFLTGVLKSIERVGNKLPDPLMIFVWGILLIIVASGILSAFDVGVLDSRPNGDGGLIKIKSLMSGDGIRFIFSNMVTNYTGFAPLGTVLVALLGLGVASHAGLIKYTLQIVVTNVKSKDLVIFIVILVGILSNLATDVGYVLLIPLGAIIFYGFGMHPLAGIAAAFAGVSGGFSANLLLGSLDPLLSGLTQEAAHLVDPSYRVGAEANFYFMALSAVMVSILGYIVTKKIVIPFLGEFHPPEKFDTSLMELKAPSEKEKRAFKLTGVVALILVVLLVISVYPEKGVLLNQETLGIARSPFLNSVVPFVFGFFFLTGLAFGFASGNFKSHLDVVEAMKKIFQDTSMYLVLIFFVAQFVAFIQYTDIAFVMALAGAEFFGSLGISLKLLLILTIFIAGFLNLFMGSASAKWAILAPVFIPLFMLLGVAPEVVQVSYRIGDSVTNIISPMNTYLALIILECTRYSKNFGIGSLVSMMLPYSIVFLVGWSLLFYVYIFVFGLPVGPGLEHPYLYDGGL